ncbi:MAG: AbrB/MazE/SpoVT family DNA-binding domain-containing protein [Candidatus Freyarchaeum deiterrae]
MAKIGKGKFIFGTVKVGERGQIVIPKEARELFKINPGDTLLVAGDLNKGLAIAKVEGIKGYILKILSAPEDKPSDIQEVPKASEEDESEEESDK